MMFWLATISALLTGAAFFVRLYQIEKTTFNEVSSEFFIVLALSLTASTIFYFINVYLPEAKKKYECNKNISGSLAKIEYNIDIIEKTFNFSKLSEAGFSNSSAEKFNTTVPQKDSIGIYTPTAAGGIRDLDIAVSLALMGAATLLDEVSLLNDFYTPTQRMLLIKLKSRIPNKYNTMSYTDVLLPDPNYPLVRIFSDYMSFSSTFKDALSNKLICSEQVLHLKSKIKNELMKQNSR